jgi:glutaredoxin
MRVTLYGKPECHLCDDAKAVLERLAGEYGLVVETVDITQDPDLWERYWDVIPVLEIEGGPTLASKITEHRLRRALERATGARY